MMFIGIALKLLKSGCIFQGMLPKKLLKNKKHPPISIHQRQIAPKFIVSLEYLAFVEKLLTLIYHHLYPFGPQI